MRAPRFRLPRTAPPAGESRRDLGYLLRLVRGRRRSRLNRRRGGGARRPRLRQRVAKRLRELLAALWLLEAGLGKVRAHQLRLVVGALLTAPPPLVRRGRLLRLLPRLRAREAEVGLRSGNIQDQVRQACARCTTSTPREPQGPRIHSRDAHTQPRRDAPSRAGGGVRGSVAASRRVCVRGRRVHLDRRVELRERAWAQGRGVTRGAAPARSLAAAWPRRE